MATRVNRAQRIDALQIKGGEDATRDLELVKLQGHRNDWYVRHARRIADCGERRPCGMTAAVSHGCRDVDEEASVGERTARQEVLEQTRQAVL